MRTKVIVALGVLFTGAAQAQPKPRATIQAGIELIGFLVGREHACTKAFGATPDRTRSEIVSIAKKMGYVEGDETHERLLLLHSVRVSGEMRDAKGGPKEKECLEGRVILDDVVKQANGG
ncbi:hypothetical protein QO058_04440 [Bosea vestrisii]|uniref:hypothetical protein n=1 Tax=Bosea vestrisii TaxID=151416 RepID=UPI0024DFAD3F|nr:hypothetical protein [Bosea vestrisii]WID97522.1 hypothetical protein QO058_04440 [Bosea vestrisii]